jgi:hypothetical protein
VVRWPWWNFVLRRTRVACAQWGVGCVELLMSDERMSAERHRCCFLGTRAPSFMFKSAKPRLCPVHCSRLLGTIPASKTSAGRWSKVQSRDEVGCIEANSDHEASSALAVRFFWCGVCVCVWASVVVQRSARP